MELTPDNVEGWSMLARTYMVMGQYEKAADALYRVQDLVGENPDIMVDIADALAMQQGGQLDGEPIALLRKALALNPDQLKALWLIGMYEFQKGNAAEALVHWRKLEPMLMNDQESLQELRQLISRAESQTGQVTVQPTQIAQPVVANTGALTVRVSMSPELIGQFGPDDTLFIFARAKSGSPMPLAVYRGRASELPLEVVLDDSMAMTPMMKLSAFPDVSVMARISKSGQAKAAPGDLFGMARGSVAPGQAEAVSILIDQVQN
jgi:cytochrome c-type biogenesis protein CcmH